MGMGPGMDAHFVFVLGARDEEGKFIADDPSTPDVNEAWTTAGEPEVKEKK